MRLTIVRIVLYTSLLSLLFVAIVDRPASGGSAVLPDLVSQAPEQVLPPEEIVFGNERLLGIRFDGYVSNLGHGDLRIAGNPSTGEVFQEVFDGSGWQPVRLVELAYENDDDHSHWHVKRIMEYSLWNANMTEQVGPAAKVGFCLFDAQRVSDGPSIAGYTYASVNYCEQGNPGSSSIVMGVTAGWRDLYPLSLNLQWIDVSDVQPGVYRIATLSDPDDQIIESDETNNGHTFTQRTVTVPGYVAASVEVWTPGQIDIELPIERFGAPGTPSFTLSQPISGSLKATERLGIYRFTPDDGFWGRTHFSFSVEDSGSEYPRNPVQAEVTVDVSLFIDVPPTNPFFDDIMWIGSAGITLGCDANRYCPTDTVTREQMASFLSRALDLPPAPQGTNTFTDDDNSPHQTDIEVLAQAGITLGCDTNRYCPNDTVTREQMAAFLLRGSVHTTK